MKYPFVVNQLLKNKYKTLLIAKKRFEIGKSGNFTVEVGRCTNSVLCRNGMAPDPFLKVDVRGTVFLIPFLPTIKTPASAESLTNLER